MYGWSFRSNASVCSVQRAKNASLLMPSRFRTKVNDTTIWLPPNWTERHDTLWRPSEQRNDMTDRVYSQSEIQDRFAIEDLYDRQLAAAEAWDLTTYDTTCAATAEIDLRDFAQPVRSYAHYRGWLQSLRTVIVKAQRLTGGLRLHLDS